MENVFRVCMALYKHERGWESRVCITVSLGSVIENCWENSRHLCKALTSSRVCITVPNSPNPSSVYIGLCKRGKKVFYCFYKTTSSKNYNAWKGKKIHFTDQNVSSYNIDLTMRFLNWQIKTYILKIWWWRVYNSCIFTSHNLSANQSTRTILVIL